MATLGAGQIMQLADFTSIRNAADQRPFVWLLPNAVQSLPNNTNTAIDFQSEIVDTHGFHSTSVNISRITPTIAGIYKFVGVLYMTTGNTDYTSVSAFIRLNGATNLAPAGREGNVVTSLARSVEVAQVLQSMNGTTDYIELVALQINTAAAARNTNNNSQFMCTLTAEYLRLP